MSIGSELNRKDGRLKVTGGADYTADTKLAGLLYGAFATSTVPSGTIASLDTRAAEGAPGVVHVMTHRNAPRLPPLGPPAAMTFLPLQADQIHYEGQPVALVVAGSLEDATYAASLVRSQCTVRSGRMTVREVLGTNGADGRSADASAAGAPDDFDALATPAPGYDEPDTRTGDPDAALRAASTRVRQRYTIGFRHHNPMEPSATIASWDGDRLTMYDATQHVWGVRSVMAQAFALPPDQVRVISHFLGGGFGCKGYVWPHEILTALAARIVRRPVKLVLTRAQMYAACGYQTETVHDVALGATRDGRLVAISHDVAYANSIADDFPEYAAAGTRTMYACPAIATRHRVVKVNTVQPTAMRAPNEGMGNFALESAMDELAAELDIDPLELRLRNYADKDPTTGKPYSSKKLREAYHLAAERFGWSRRPLRPRAIRDGNDLVGYGMASALMTTYRFPSTARRDAARRCGHRPGRVAGDRHRRAHDHAADRGRSPRRPSLPRGDAPRRHGPSGSGNNRRLVKHDGARLRRGRCGGEAPPDLAANGDRGPRLAALRGADRGSRGTRRRRRHPEGEPGPNGHACRDGAPERSGGDRCRRGVVARRARFWRFSLRDVHVRRRLCRSAGRC